jgi:superfamily II DNA or RNA helicase
MKAEIVIEGADAKISGDYPVEIVANATSYYQAGYQFVPRFRSGHWDGKVKLFSKLYKTFPSGLVKDVTKALEEAGVTVLIDDKRKCSKISPIPSNIKLHGVSFEYPYDYQIDCMKAMLKEHRGVVEMATGAGKTEQSCLVMACLRIPTLFLVPGKELLYQTRNRFATRFGIPSSEIGIIGDGNWLPNPWITVAIVASLYDALKAGKQKVFELLDKIDLLFIDECHKVGSDSFYDVARECKAFWRYGLSATPMKRTDGANLKLTAVTGPVIFKISNKELIERGVNCEAEIRLVPVRQPYIQKGTPYKDAYKVGVVDNLYRNKLICGIASQLVEEGRHVLILVKEILHGKQIDKRLWNFHSQSFLAHQFITGKEPMFVRQKAVKDFANGEIQVLCSSPLFDEGIDLPAINVIILGGSGKSTIKTLQRIGRGLRKGDGKKLIVVDTIDFTSKYLLEHSYQRVKDYRGEDCFDIIEYDLSSILKEIQ